MKAPVSHLRAILYALAGFAIWVLSDTCMKLASEAALPPYEIVGFLGLFSGLFILLKAWPQKGVKALWPKHPYSQLGRALLALSSNFFNVIALKHLPLTMFYVTVFMAPMTIAILAAFFLRERLTMPKILAVAAGFAGVVIAIDPARNLTGGDWIGYAAAFTSMIAFAVAIVWLRVMTRSETPDSLAFFVAFIEAIFGFALMLGHAEPLTLRLLLILVAMGVLCAIGNIVIYTAIKHTTAANVSQFHYTQLITGALLGYLIWHDVPAFHMIVGAGIIIASGLYIAAHARKAGKAPLAPL